MGWLYRYEAKGIQSWVLGTTRLQEIAGGSALVEELPRRLNAPKSAQIVQSAAGSATVLFETQGQLESFAAEWPMLVDRHLPGLQVVQGWAEGHSSQALGEVLRHKLPAARNRLWPELPEAGPWMARAGRTGRPAVGRGTRTKSGLQDRPLHARLTAGCGSGGGLETKLLEGADLERGFLRRHDHFGTSDIAVVHLDGNDVGRRVFDLTRREDSLEAFRRFSFVLGRITADAAKAAVTAVLSDARPSDDAPHADLRLRPVVLGGDDFTALVRAPYALRFARTFLESFNAGAQRAASDLGGPLNASAGIAFVKERAPFYTAQRLASQLCHAAKDALRSRDGGLTPSGILFHRLGSSSHLDWQELKATELTARPETALPVTGALSFGPYRLGEQLDALGSLVEASRDLPHGALREWARAAASDAREHGFRWSRFCEVQRERSKGVLEKLGRALERLGCRAEHPWSDDLRTPIHEALTLRALGVVS